MCDVPQLIRVALAENAGPVVQFQAAIGVLDLAARLGANAAPRWHIAVAGPLDHHTFALESAIEATIQEGA